MVYPETDRRNLDLSGSVCRSAELRDGMANLSVLAFVEGARQSWLRSSYAPAHHCR